MFSVWSDKQLGNTLSGLRLCIQFCEATNPAHPDGHHLEERNHHGVGCLACPDEAAYPCTTCSHLQEHRHTGHCVVLGQKSDALEYVTIVTIHLAVHHVRTLVCSSQDSAQEHTHCNQV